MQSAILSSRRRWFGTPFAMLLVFSGSASVSPTIGPPANRTVVIRMTDEMRFVPDNPSVAVGDTLVWVNDGGMPHTTTDKPGTAAVNEHNVLPKGATVWDSGLLKTGERFSQVLTVPGEYTYLCYIHEALGMVGRVTVQ